jgi:RimJ/RimL family protein N-acetyltransferase
MPSGPLPVVPDALETERLVLRSPMPGDGAALNAAVIESFDELRVWMPWAHRLPTVEETEAHVCSARGAYLERTDLPLLIFLRDSGTLIGATGLHRMDWQVPRFEIGYWIRKGYSGKGYVTESVRALTKFAFDLLQAQRVEIHCSEQNVRSQRVAERSGFLLEARLKKHRRGAGDTVEDTLVYARTQP